MAGDQTVNVRVNAIGNFSSLTGEINKFKSQLKGIKLPGNIGTDLEKSLTNLESKYSKFQSLASKGINTKGDLSKLQSSAREVEKEMVNIEKLMSSISSKDIKMAAFDSSEVKAAEAELQKYIKLGEELTNFGTKKGVGVFSEAEVARIEKIANTSKGLKSKFEGVMKAFQTGDIDKVNTAMQELIRHATTYQNRMKEGKASAILDWTSKGTQQLSEFTSKAEQAKTAMDKIVSGKIQQLQGIFNGATTGVNNFNNGLRQTIASEMEVASRASQMNEQVNHLRTQANYFFGLQNMGRLIARGIREAAESVRDLDKAMTETAVVTEFSVGDMWNMLPEYTKLANKLGATTQGAYETMTLYFQQGLDKKATFEIGEETMKMARIAGLDYADTTNMMTAALRGFNMELNRTSAKRVNDVYSKLAAITASDTRELGLAMERTASIAHSANMDFGNVSAFLAQMIETTREAPENLGTAMKTIIARFQELKENPYSISEVEGEEVDFNKVDKALKSIGVDLMDNRDKFRDLDDVFMDISSKWDGLSQTQQRYVATIAAGARQQSRFLAMVQNYDRLKELTDAAANSEGASNVQFIKTLESYGAKVNRLKNAWQAFTMSLANNKAVKGGIDLLQNIITLGNKIIQTFGKIGGVFGDVGKGIGEMTAAFGLGAIGFKGLKVGANTGLGLLARITSANAKNDNQMFPGVGGGPSANFAAKISNPIVNAINKLTAIITKQPFKEPAVRDIRDSNALLKNRRAELYNIARKNTVEGRMTSTPFEQMLFGSQKYKKTYEGFNANKIRKQFGGLQAAEQKALYKSTPAIQQALQRGYAEAYKKLNLTPEATAALNKHWKQVDKQVKSGQISAGDAYRHLYDPSSIAKVIDSPEATQQIKQALDNQIKGWSKDYKAKVNRVLGQKSREKGLEGQEAVKWRQDKRREIAAKQTNVGGEQTAYLTKVTGAMTKLTGASNVAGQAVMGVGMALSSAGFGVAGAAVSAIGSGIMGIGMAAEGATALVSKLGVAMTGLSLASLANPILLAAVGAAAAVTAGIIALKKHQKTIQETQKESKKVLKDYESEVEKTTSNINKLTDYKDSYIRLQKGVDRNNNNIDLGTEDYADYLKIINDVAKMHPELVKGYNAQGQAILNTNNAVQKAIKLEKERADKAAENFTKAESLDKLIAGRDSTKRWKVGQSGQQEYTGRNKRRSMNLDSGYSKLQMDASDVISTIKKLEGGQDLLNSMAEQFGIQASDFNNLTDEGVRAIQQHGENMLNQVQSQLSVAGNKANQELIKNVQNGIAQVGKDTQGIEEVTEPIYKSLSTFASRTGLFDNIPDELKGAAEKGLKEIAKMSIDPATGGKITGAAMQEQAMIQAKQLENLNGHSQEYKNLLDDIAKSQEDFSKNLSESEYNTATQAAIDKLTVWANDARNAGGEMQTAIAESFEAQIDSIRNFVDEGSALLEDGFNTFADQIEGANGAFESFQKQIEGGDFYTGAENMKKIFDEIQDGVDNVGKGSQTFWKGAEQLLGSTNENIKSGNFKAVENQIKSLEPMFKEGIDGANAFFDHVAKKQTETLDTTGQKVSELFKVADGEVDLNLNNLSAEHFTDLANKLGMSDQMLASMLNKAKQFYDIDFSNVDILRNALYSAESSIRGNKSTFNKETGESYQNLYTRQSTFEAEASAQGYTPVEIKDLVKNVEKEGIKLIPDADALTGLKADDFKSTMGGYIKDMGIQSTQGFVDTFSQLGFGKDEIEALYDKGVEQGLLGESKYDNFDQYYNDTLKKQQESVANTAEEQTADNTAKTAQTAQAILGALGVSTGDGAKALEKILGGKGQDTAAQFFATGEDKYGNAFKTRADYETGRSELQADIEEWKLAKAGIEASIEDTSGKQRETLQAELDGYNSAIAYGEKYLAAGDKVWREREAQLEKEAASLELYESKLGDKGAAQIAPQDILTPEEAQKAWGLSDEELNGYQEKYNRIVQMHNEAVTSISQGMGLNEEQGQLFGASFSAEKLNQLTTFKDTFSQVANGVKLTDEQIQQLGGSLSGMSVDKLNSLTAEDFGPLLSNLKLTDEQIKQLEENNPKIKFEADTTEVDKVTGGNSTVPTGTGTANQTIGITLTPSITNQASINSEINSAIPATLPIKNTNQPVTIKISPTVEDKSVVNTIVAGTVPNTLEIKNTKQPVTIKINPTIEDRLVVNTVVSGAVPATLPVKTVTQPVSVTLKPTISNPNAVNEKTKDIQGSQTAITVNTTEQKTINVTANITKVNDEKARAEGIKATATVDKVTKGNSVSGEPIKVKATATVTNVSAPKQTKQVKGTTTKNTVTTEAKTTGQGKVSALGSAIQAIKNKTVSIAARVTGASQVTSLKNAISNLRDKTVTVTYRQNGSPGPSTGGYITPAGVIYRSRGGIAEYPGYPKKGTDRIPAYLTPGEYVQNRGAVKYFGVDFMRKINHKDLNGALQSFGSAANGRYGRLGPEGKGGLTLTGEKGFEIAWIPSESRSMILGANGPQMIDLPSDAVVWNNEQSKKIIKQNAIPAGSQYSAKGRFKYKSSNQNNPSGSKNSKNSKKSKGGKGKGGKGKGDSSSKIITEIKQKAGKINEWWWNMTKKVEATQRTIDKLAKQLETTFKRFGKTLDDIKGTADKYKAALNTQMRLNTEMKKSAANSLVKVDKGDSKVAKKVKAEDKKVAKAQKKYDKAKSKKSKAKAKKALNKAKKNRDKAKTGENYATVSYEVTKKTKKKDKKGKWKTTSKKVKKSARIDLAPYIYQDKETGAYQIDYDKINKNFGKNSSQAKAVGEAAKKKVEDLQGKYNTAEDNYEKAKEALAKLSDDVYTTFYDWEKSITSLYLLSHKLEEISKRITIASARAEVEFSKLVAGMGKVDEGLPRVLSALNEERSQLLFQAQYSQLAVESALQEFREAIDWTTYEEKWLPNKGSAIATDKYEAAKVAFNILKNANLDSGTFNYNDVLKDVSTALSQLHNKQYNEETYNKVKEVLDKIYEKQGQYLEKINEAYDNLSAIYEKMEEMQSYLAEFETDLISGLEELAEDEIERLDRLNSSLAKAYKDLLDEVKRRLEERRKQEDNAKTESDISKKQQRLAALRADTAGGHQVEIAQLEKEIAEEQQNYRRSLEDQLLDKLQAQGDEAEKQRQRQIDLLEAQKEIAKELGTNIEEVRKWLENDESRELYKEQIKQAWLANKNYDEAAPREQTQLEEQFEEAWTKYLAYYADLPNYQSAVKNSLSTVEGKLDTIADNILKINNNSAAAMKLAGQSAANLYKAGFSASALAEAGYTTKEIAEAGYNKSQLQEAGIDTTAIKSWNESNPENKISGNAIKNAGFNVTEAIDVGINTLSDLKNAGYSTVEDRGAGFNNINDYIGVYSWKEIGQAFSAQEFKAANVSYTNAKAAGYTPNNLKGIYSEAQAEINAEEKRKKEQAYQNKLAAAVKNGKTSWAELQAVEKVANAAGYGARTWIPALAAQDGAGGVTWVKIFKALKGHFSKYRIALSFTSDAAKKAYNTVWGSDSYKKDRAYALKYPKKYQPYSYQTGGLADYTGPAWLDGTPSRPELVLNAQDTKNFLALKDVLSHAMNSMYSAPAAYGDVNVGVTINVDNISNDYDVDRLVQRVKKDITKDMGYRNVTQVRNFK